MSNVFSLTKYGEIDFGQQIAFRATSLVALSHSVSQLIPSTLVLPSSTPLPNVSFAGLSSLSIISRFPTSCCDGLLDLKQPVKQVHNFSIFSNGTR